MVIKVKIVMDNGGGRVTGIKDVKNKYDASQVTSFDKLKQDWSDACVAMRTEYSEIANNDKETLDAYRKT